MRKKKGLTLLSLTPVTALIFLIYGFWWFRSLSPVSPEGVTSGKLFVIQKGENLPSIANRLEKENLIRSSLAFKTLVLIKGLSGKIQAGEFSLRPSLSSSEVASLLTHGSLDIWLTFPEGWRREEIARRLTSNLEGFDYQEFIALTEKQEGYLFPDTYLIPKQATAGAVIKIFTNNFEKKFTHDLEMIAQNEGLTRKQVLILASIVERESRFDQDRPTVAGILLKRWREDWPLQADATAQYAIATEGFNNLTTKKWEYYDWWPKKLTKADLEIDSPYNTYRYKGLPAGPICNPGLASINAVIKPQMTDYWFYLSDDKGKIHYAKTKEEHAWNVVEYLN